MTILIQETNVCSVFDKTKFRAYVMLIILQNQETQTHENKTLLPPGIDPCFRSRRIWNTDREAVEALLSRPWTLWVSTVATSTV